MRVCTLASGSGGNSLFVESGSTRLLVDAGLSGRELESRLAAVGVDPSSIAAIVFTHEHADHVSGAGVFGRRYRVPLYFNPGTLRYVSNLRKCVVREFESGEPFAIGDLEVTPFSVSHDAADPVGFVIGDGRARVGLAADLGFASRLVSHRLSGADVLLIESNHDPYMLETGPYPRDLKQRVAGKRGHLSNVQCGDLIEELVHGGLTHLGLVHISEKNNTPRVALEAASARLIRAGAGDLDLFVADQYRPGSMLDF